MGRANIPKYGIAVDFETSGLNVKNNQGISLGVIVFDTKTFEPVSAGIYWEIKFDPKYEWSPGAQNVHGLSREYLEEHGQTQEEVALQFLEFLWLTCGRDERVMYLGHNAQFDIGFMQQLLATIGYEFTTEPKTAQAVHLHHIILDTTSLGFITLGVYRSDKVFEKLYFPKRDKHNALDDIEMTLQTAQSIRSLVEVKLAETFA